MVNFYRKYIAEGKSIAVFSIMISLALRGWLYVDTPTNSYLTEPANLLWDWVFEATHLELPSLAVMSYLMALTTSILLSFAAWHYVLIRDRSFLPFSIGLLIFSSHPYFLIFSPSDLAALIFIVAICLTFDLFQHPAPQWRLFNVGMIASIASLISIGVLPYIILLLFALPFFRITNLKNILAFILGILFIYWIAGTVFVALGQWNLFFEHFSQLQQINILKVVHFEMIEWGMLSVYLILILLTFLAYQLTMHKDKIKTRILLNYLFFLSFLFYLSYCLLNWDPRLALSLGISTFVVPLSHFFALTDSKVKIIFFYVLLVLYLAVSFGLIYFF